MAKTRDLVDATTASLDAYDLFGACQHVRDHLDVLTNWYIRRSRSRFWEGDHDAIDTMHTVLAVLVRITAPLLPFISEAIHHGMNDGMNDDMNDGANQVTNPFATGPQQPSVHLLDWPAADELPANDDLVESMDLVRDVCSATLSIRKAHQRRVRLPLNSVTVATAQADRLAAFVDVISDEVNVRSVVLTTDVAAVATEQLRLVPKTLGPRLGSNVQTVIKAHKAGDWTAVDGIITVGGVELLDGEYTLDLVAAEAGGDGLASAGLARAGGVVALDISVTDELEVEGRARDLVRLVQQARREADLHVSDRITLTITAAQPWLDAIERHEQLLAAETLATAVVTHLGPDGGEPDIAVVAS